MRIDAGSVIRIGMMNLLFDDQAPKNATNLSINSDLLAKI
ncbi:MAG: hypothetical protein ACI9XK_003746 [Granulosicoccus sp.]|jgi:hypothetical protein